MNSQVSCEICESVAPYWAGISGYDHYRCKQCAHLFVYPRPSQDDLDKFYQTGTYYDRAELQSDRLAREARQRLLLLKTLGDALGLAHRLLDVGCATGYFLLGAREHGWTAEGIERSESVAAIARTRCGLPVHVGILERTRIPGSPFPLVTAWEVVEHARDPRSFFQALVNNVAPGGLLAISTPLSNGIPARVMGAKFPMLAPPEHLSIFSRKSLGALAKEGGCEEIYFSSFSNLDAMALASGYSRLLFGKQFSELSGTRRLFVKGLALACAWLPRVIDRAGIGTEMLVVYRRSKQ